MARPLPKSPPKKAERGRRLRRHPLGRAPLPRKSLPEGKAEGAPVGQGAAPTAFRGLGSRVDHHDVWQRARLTLACVAREHKELQELLDGAERYLAGQAFELGQVEREVVTFE